MLVITYVYFILLAIVFSIITLINMFEDGEDPEFNKIHRSLCVLIIGSCIGFFAGNSSRPLFEYPENELPQTKEVGPSGK